jgi:hypothetical protein
VQNILIYNDLMWDKINAYKHHGPPLFLRSDTQQSCLHCYTKLSVPRHCSYITSHQSLTVEQEVEHDHGLTNQEMFLTNHDLKIVEPERRQWTAFNFVGFWIADSFNINTWMIAASSLDNGLSWWQAWICVWYELHRKK